ncbi:hypothetical protein [Sporomusa sp.]|uniref:hypothetical protein n=1 Tax=Sporomusa sp. TaxID=2078658 RepID=UPI002BE06E43|nr:hypothetical protein [Sporomusa sp.]HWR45447.1 hypothetical protein [Sporomusa sp.]
MNKDTEDLKVAGWFLLSMGLSMKALAARINENNLETVRLEQGSDRNDVAIGDTTTAGLFCNEEP